MRKRSLDFTAGTVEPEGLRLLSRLANNVSVGGGCSPVIEIGTLFGRTAIEIAEAMSSWEHPPVVITVDRYSWNPWGLTDESHFLLTSEILRFAKERGRIDQRRMSADEFYASYKSPSPSLFFYDADHSEKAVTRAIAWARSVKAHTICGHDYCPEFPGTMKAVDAAGGPREVQGRVWVL